MSTATITKHTPTPWTHTKLCGQASGPHAETCIGIIGQNEVAVAWISLNPSQGDKVEDGMADAARIVRCVNACSDEGTVVAALKDALIFIDPRSSTGAAIAHKKIALALRAIQA